MNLNSKEAITFMEKFNQKTKEYKFNIEHGIAPTFLTIKNVKELANDDFIVASQDAHFQAKGAFTGNISYKQLKDEGISWAIVGHSERRAMFNDTDETINKKVISLVSNNMVAVLCVGETLEEYEAKKTTEIVTSQLSKDLIGVSDDKLKNIIIAYEPIWAIGTGKTASSLDAQNTIATIRTKIEKMYSKEISEKILILYGGSVKPTNIKELLSQKDIDGALVGGASLKVDDFIGLITADENWFVKKGVN